MQIVGISPSCHALDRHGLRDLSTEYWNLGTPELFEQAIRRGEGLLANTGSLVVKTGQFTGRSPKDKYIVHEAGTETTVEWGSVNQPMSEQQFETLYARVLDHWCGKDAFIQDCCAGADPGYALPIRVVTRRAWHSLFARQLFIRPEPGTTGAHAPEFTILFAPEFQADPQTDGTRSSTCIALNFKRRIILIVGTEYAGEMKKSVFSVLNYWLPSQDVLPMHCSANMGRDGRVALFFGLSGTGKTTLSTDPGRRLIGDDEHGWSNRGVFNIEGGCYAKCIHLSKEKEPQIWNAIRFGTVLENVVIDPVTRRLDFDSAEITENTRAAYRLDAIEGALIPSVGGHPSHILFLTADAFGVLPPIARLTPEQAMYHFLSGYTAKVAGTERGLGNEPVATFSACFAAPFLPRYPLVYARMLGDRMREHNVTCYLVNTGWVAGPYGVGHRMSLPYTRAIVDAAVEGRLDHVAGKAHPVFQVLVPESVPGVPAELLDPRALWKDRQSYDRAAGDLNARFRKNFEKFGAGADEILEAAPAMK
jgi:phosphoenolpyruvate carboxykinase (ATP)